MKARVIYLLLCAALLAGIVAADSGTGAAYQPASTDTISSRTGTASSREGAWEYRSPQA